MSSFTTPLEYEDTGTFRSGRPVFRLTSPFSYEFGYEGSGLIFTVPIGFHTDLASTPKMLTWAFPPDGPYVKAAVLHDMLYVTGVIQNRYFSDLIFWDAMTNTSLPVDHQVPKRLAVPVYYAVRAGGSSTWNRYRAVKKSIRKMKGISDRLS